MAVQMNVVVGRRTSIVDRRTIFPVAYVLTESWTRLRLTSDVTHSYETTVNWLVRRRLLHNTFPCGFCGRPCSVLTNGSYVEKYMWYCRPCRFSRSVRHGSVFTSQHASLQTQLLLLYEWSNETPLSCCEHEYTISHMTAVHYYTNFRQLCVRYLALHPIVVGGVELVNGQVVPRTVEIDESYFSRRKYNRGHHRIRRGIWVLGIIERNSLRCFMQPVATRDEATLRPLIEAHVDVGTIIHTDMWRAYNTLAQSANGYVHYTVNHSQNFVHPIDRQVHTNNVENLWHRVKRKHARISGKTSISRSVTAGQMQI